MSPATVLFIVTSHAALGNSGHATGLWFEELSTPYYVVKDAGYSVAIASIDGGIVPIDPHSQKAAGENPASVERFLKDADAMAALKNSLPIKDVKADDYVAIFLPGGHGTMWDMPSSQPLAQMVSTMMDSGKYVAAVCHGPAGLVSAVNKDGTPLVKGRTIATFTDSEESAVGLTTTVPFLLESRLRELGATIKSGPNFEPFAVADGHLITGQNPASSDKVAELLVAALKAKP